MAPLDPQFYDQLQQRLNKQDAALDRIEEGQANLLNCMSTHKTVLASHEASDKSNFRWILYVFTGVWIAIATLFGFSVKH